MTRLVRRWRRKRFMRRARALAVATRMAYASKAPYAAYAAVNRLQFLWKPELASSMVGDLPEEVRAQAADRIKFRVLHDALAFLVQEALLAEHGFSNARYLPLPKQARRVWPHQNLSSVASLLRFALVLAGQYRRALRRFRALARLRLRSVQDRAAKYIVTFNFPTTTLESAACGRGVLRWLARSSPLAGTFDKIWFAPSKLDGAVGCTHPPGVDVREEAFPLLGGEGARRRFLLQGARYLFMALCDLLVGRWQRVVLLEDLIELSYVRELRLENLAQAYIFSLADQMHRPLWTWHVEAQGASVLLLFYASSFTLFHYNNAKVDPRILHPAIAGNQWSQCWFQSQKAREAIAPKLGNCRESLVAGPFDMVDNDVEIPLLPARSIAIFDVEPISRPLRASLFGYIVPYLGEAIIVDFWRDLAWVAERHDLVLVHKPKRPNPRVREWDYLRLLADLKHNGRYMDLPCDLGPSRLLDRVALAVALPFTSVGDLDPASRGCAFAYYDARGAISEPDQHAGGCRVIAGRHALEAWISGHAGMCRRTETARVHT